MIEPFINPGDEEVTSLNTDWLLDNNVMTLKERQNMEQKEYSHCLRCGRKLKNDKAKKIGYGVVCLKKVKAERRCKKLF